jgi:collagenase-like PrtC family protease
LNNFIKYSIGNKWEDLFLDQIIELNQIYKSRGSQIVELYGSKRTDIVSMNSARPNWRLPKISNYFIKKYIERAHKYGIKINYTINAPLHDSVKSIFNNKEKIRDEVLKIVDLGVDTLTMSNSLLIELVNTISSIPIDISSLLHVNSLSQIPVYNEWNAKHICMDVIKNRDLCFLKSFTSMANAYNIETKLIVNEYCSYNGAPCFGIRQADCVIHSALKGNVEKHFNSWPYHSCFESRNKDLSNWLKSKFILPQWIQRYRDFTGINFYKITGRTKETQWLLKTVESYMSFSFDGDIRCLGHNQWDNNKSMNMAAFLESKYLDENRFIDHWFDNPAFLCSDNCIHKCNYCKTFTTQ